MNVLWWLFTALWISALGGFIIVVLLEVICWIIATIRDWFR